ncbi:DUF2304 family protein [Kiloniella majae]|uniref:DUF2304 family protein n=1 Tax=Kiloniella majae TaxID=1938558 RepID=UPI000A27864E|nr:DUF2304 family protein [Kiloniella majae]
MIDFFSDVQNLGLSMLTALFAFTLWLLRTNRLDAHITVRWLFVELIAIALLAMWKWLPVFGYTSGLADRELILILVIGAFVFAAILILDILVLLSKQARQIKTLAQELALLRQRTDVVEDYRMSK